MSRETSCEPPSHSNLAPSPPPRPLGHRRHGRRLPDRRVGRVQRRVRGVLGGSGGVVRINGRSLASSAKLQAALGCRFGSLAVIAIIPASPGVLARFDCRCDCGRLFSAQAGNVMGGRSRTCGRCTRRPPVVVGDIVHIPLTREKIAIVDLVDKELGLRNWQAHLGASGIWYATGGRVDSDSELPVLHRLVAKRAGIVIDGLFVDHVDSDGLNCRRSNLRAATPCQNQQNRRRAANNTSGIKGAYFDKRFGKWRADITVSGRRLFLGYFANMELAGEAYARAAKVHYGEFARAA